MKKIIVMILLVSLISTLLPMSTWAYASNSSYSVTIGTKRIPFADYPAGTYFTDNGKACVDHNSCGSGASYNNENACNCKCTWNGVALLSTSCYGFANMVFYRLFGHTTYTKTKKVITNVNSSTINVTYLKNLFNGSTVKPGAHIRTNAGHSMIFMGCDTSNFYTYEGNYDGKCGVGVISRTWEEFSSYLVGRNGIAFIEMPTDYPSVSMNTPEKPIISVSKTTWKTNEEISFSWQKCANTDHYFPMVWDEKGNRVKVIWGTTATEYKFDLPAGKYALQVQSVKENKNAEASINTSELVSIEVVSDGRFNSDSYVARIFGDNGHEYRMYNYVCSWEDAKELCEDMDGYLATITSRSEFNEVVSFIKKYSAGSYYYIGGTDKQNEGTWKWVTGEKWSFDDLWNPGEPNNAGDEDYMSLYQLANDLPTTSHLGFICEIEEETIKPESIRLTTGEILLETGKTHTLTAKVTPGDSEYKVVWESSKPSVAKINSKGKITAVAPGNAVITVTLLDKNDIFVDEKYCEVIVYEEQDVELELTIGSKNAKVSGTKKTNDVAPLIKNGRTMLPARFVAENLGADVLWDEKNNKVTITKDDINIVITIGKNKASVNGGTVYLDSPAFIENGRTYTPVRFIAEELGAEVTWYESTKTVKIKGRK